MAQADVKGMGLVRKSPWISHTTTIRVVTFVIIWGAYEFLAQSSLLFRGVVPSSFFVMQALVSILLDRSFYFDLLITVVEIASGFLLGSIIGIATGIILGMWVLMGRMLNSWIHALAPTPKIIFLPILMLFFGVGMGSKIAIATVTAFFPVVVTTYAAMGRVDPVHLRVAATFQASRWQLVRMVYIPSLVGPVTVSLQLALGVSFIVTLLAEIKLSEYGLGHLIIQYYNFMHIPDMYALLLLTFILAGTSNAAMGWLVSRVEHERG